MVCGGHMTGRRSLALYCGRACQSKASRQRARVEPELEPLTELEELLASWELHLRAERKSPQTVKVYGDGVRAYVRFCLDAGQPVEIDRTRLREFVDHLLASGAKPATATARHLAMRRFSAWLTDEQLRAMVKACKGPEMRDKRDEAILSLMYTSGARAGEVVALRLDDLQLKANPPTVTIRRGKGGRGRVVPLALEAAAAIDRYIRARKGHRLARTGDLWLGDRGKAFSYDALHKTLRYRAERAGVDGFHPHRLRHTAAHRWLAKGGSEGGLMAVAGWTRPEMLLRYTRANASQRAAEEAQRLDLGAL